MLRKVRVFLRMEGKTGQIRAEGLKDVHFAQSRKNTCKV